MGCARAICPAAETRETVKVAVLGGQEGKAAISLRVDPLLVLSQFSRIPYLRYSVLYTLVWRLPYQHLDFEHNHCQIA